MTDSKAIDTQLPELQEQSPKDGSEDATKKAQCDYRGLVGSLNCLSLSSRPDIANAAHSLSIFLENPGEEHWITAKRVVRYLKRTKGQYLC